MASKRKVMSGGSLDEMTKAFNEDVWVIQVRTSIETEVDEADAKTRVSIFCVPPALMASKPEVYVPQVFAFGPYHHWLPRLHDVERHKHGAAKKIQAQLNGVRFGDIVDQFEKRDFKIRCHYFKNLDMSSKTLAWMMAIDASFLVEFLHNRYAHLQTDSSAEPPAGPAPAKTLSKQMELDRIKAWFSMILRDMTMLENQVPLFLLRKLLGIIYGGSKEAAEEMLSKLLVEFVREVSPLKNTNYDDQMVTYDIARRAHLVDVLYYSIVPKEPPSQGETEDDIGEDFNGDETEADQKKVHADPGTVQKAFLVVWAFLSTASGGPVRFVKGMILSQPIKLVVKFPWKILSALPILSVFKGPIESFFSQLVPKSKSEDVDQSAEKAETPPLVEEIVIPSVSELAKLGVRFCLTDPASCPLSGIAFDTTTVTLYLPEITVDHCTEVVVRNLVAYESSAVMGPMVFTRYAELMCGIIDTEEDVRILRESGVLVNQMKSNGEAATMWNGMSKSVKLSRVGFLDKAIAGVNRYYRTRWRVKLRDYMRRYVFGSWQLLTFLAAGLLLFLTCVQAFCSVYSCNSQLTNISSMKGHD